MFAASKSGKVAAAAAATDPNFKYVPLLLETTSTNGQQNNTFLDSSSNAFTITRNGTPTQGSVSPYYPTGYWSGYFNGSTDGLKGSITTGVTPTTGDFTWEGWVNFNSLASAQCLIGVGNSQDRTILYFDNTTGLNYVVARSAANQILIAQGSTAGWVVGNWYHVAVVRSGNNYTLYRNGTSIATGTSSYVASNLTQPLTVGYSDWSTSFLYTNAYLSNVRAVYGTAIVPPAGGPTSPLTAVSGTSLLTLQDNRFKDNAASPNTITVNGTPQITHQQPFAPPASYSAAAYGGSGYFNGTTDYLNVTTPGTSFTFGTSDFTIECWINVQSVQSLFKPIWTNRGTDATSVFFALYNGTTQLIYYRGGNQILDTVGLPLNTWNHVALVRSGVTVSMYKNGTLVGSVTDSTNLTGPNSYIGQESGAASGYLNAYISNLRVLKGTAVYIGAFTPPTLAPLATSGAASAASYASTTNVNTSFSASQCSLLTNFTNAGIYDAAGLNNFTTVGDAQASTTQAKWTPTSAKFDGTGDYLTAPLNPTNTITSGDFTVEFWLNPNTVATAYQAIVGTREGDTAGVINWSVLLQANALRTDIYSSGSVLMAGFVHQTVLSANTWYYCALVRSGSTFTLYVNGVASTSTGTSSATIGQSGTTLWVGRFGASSAVSALNGYIQDLRITKGIARTITTPTAAFPTR